MNQRALQTLEFNKILNRLEERAGSEPGRKLCASLAPMTSLHEINRELKETDAAIARLLKKGSVSFGSNRDLTGVVKSLAIGSVPEMRRFLEIASFLENVGRVRNYGKRDDNDEAPDALSEYFSALEPLPHSVAEIRRIVISEDEIAPDASPQLKSIRRGILQTNERIRDQLNKMVNGSLRTYLQDAVVTMRGDRYCLPVKSEHKAKVNGIVHDQSASGSTFFIEPAAVVEMNNRLREYALEEAAEIERILRELASSLAGHTTELTDNMRYMTHLDFVFAKGALALDMNAVIPEMTDEPRFHILKGRHPLIDKDTVVPIDVMLGADFTLLIITGPNTGGKTVTLKTAGLLTLMGQSGLAVPAAEHTVLGIFEEIYADIGDEQSIEQSLSTFSSHMTHTVDILANADDRSLCLFDELGAGTDPTEGAALAIAILHDLLSRGIRTMATTHYAELKVYAITTEGVRNASCEFDVETLRPTYRLLIGTPGKSNAFAISKRLGLSDAIIEDAKGRIDADAKRMEDLFADLEESRILIEKERLESARLREEASALRDRLDKSRRKMDDSKEAILARAEEDAARILAEAKAEADESIRALRRAEASGDISDMERARTRLNEGISARDKKKKKEPKEKPAAGKLRPEDLKAGDEVKIVSMGLTGTVNSKVDKDGYLFVQCGILRTKAHISDLIPIEDTSVQEVAEKFSMGKAFRDKDRGVGSYNKKGKGGESLSKAATIGGEINLIGKTVDDALIELDKYLDDAYLSHVSSVRVVHGKGTGALRAGIHRHLRQVRYVKSFKLGEFGEGDSGVTIVTFK